VTGATVVVVAAAVVVVVVVVVVVACAVVVARLVVSLSVSSRSVLVVGVVADDEKAFCVALAARPAKRPHAASAMPAIAAVKRRTRTMFRSRD
jgi:hypothetical protein